MEKIFHLNSDYVKEIKEELTSCDLEIWRSEWRSEGRVSLPEYGGFTRIVVDIEEVNLAEEIKTLDLNMNVVTSIEGASKLARLKTIVTGECRLQSIPTWFSQIQVKK